MEKIFQITKTDGRQSAFTRSRRTGAFTGKKSSQLSTDKSVKMDDLVSAMKVDQMAQEITSRR